jgi:hypothetical protein
MGSRSAAYSRNDRVRCCTHQLHGWERLPENNVSLKVKQVYLFFSHESILAISKCLILTTRKIVIAHEAGLGGRYTLWHKPILLRL